MKIAFSASGDSLDAQLDARFGRAAKFLIVDSDTDEFVIVDNTQNLNAAQGAGIQSAQHLVSAGAGALVSGHTGPKAFAVLNAAGVQIFLSPATTIREAYEAWKKGELQKIDNADVEGHWI